MTDSAGSSETENNADRQFSLLESKAPKTPPVREHAEKQTSQPSSSGIYLKYTEGLRKFLDDYKCVCGSAAVVPELKNDCLKLTELLPKVEAYNSLCQTKGKPRVEAAELLRTTYVVYHWNRDCQAVDNLSELEQMRLRSAERDYQTRVKNTLSIIRPAGVRVEDTFASARLSLGAGVNLVTGLFLTFLAGYYAGLYFVGLPHAISLMCGVALSFCCVLIEVALIIFYDRALTKKKSKVKNLRQRARSQKTTTTNIEEKRQPCPSADILCKPDDHGERNVARRRRPAVGGTGAK